MSFLVIFAQMGVSSTNLQRNPESSALLNKNLYKTAQKELFVNKQVSPFQGSASGVFDYLASRW